MHTTTPTTNDRRRVRLRAAAGRVVLAATLLLTLAACASGPDPLEAEAVRSTDVSVIDNGFEPLAVEVAAGDEVTWTWEGGGQHDVVGEGWESERQTGGEFRQTFDEAGVVEYRCSLHPGMRGVVRVVD